MIVRKYRKEDNESLVRLFYDTVRTICARDYTPAQIAVWAPDQIDPEQWCKSFEINVTFVAEIENRIVGFANMDDAGYLDRLYVAADCQRMGVAASLIQTIEKQAREKNLSEIQVDASITALPFFLRKGYAIVKENIVERRGEELKNYSMRKQL